MADYAEYNFADHKSGDTFNGKSFVFTDHPEGTLTKVELKTSKGNTIKSGNGITITSAANWSFTIDAQVIDFGKGVLAYGITTTSSLGIVKTFIRGTWTII